MSRTDVQKSENDNRKIELINTPSEDDFSQTDAHTQPVSPRNLNIETNHTNQPSGLESSSTPRASKPKISENEDLPNTQMTHVKSMSIEETLGDENSNMGNTHDNTIDTTNHVNVKQ